MPVSTRLAVLRAAGRHPIASYLADAANGGCAVPDVVAVPMKDAETTGLDPYLGGPADALIASSEFTGRAGEVHEVPLWLPGPRRPGRLLLTGLGDESPAALRKAGAALARRLPAGTTAVSSITWDQPEAAVRAFAEGLLLGGYRYPAGPDAPTAARLVDAVQDPAAVSVLLLTDDPQRCQAAADRATVTGGAVTLARDLVNTPSRIKTPDWLAREAVDLAHSSGLAARAWDAGDLAAAGFGGLIAVGAGSARPPRLIEMSYEPAGWRQHIVLVGKGITFDSGGLSLKPTDGMKTMKTDMAGGAAVIAVMSALAPLAAEVRVTGLVAAAENMPSGSALRPGDVITHYGGRTCEVLNTDAEGRLVLADALAYASAVLRPDALVDLATLTGAVRVALGTRTAAVYASEEGLAEALLAAAEASGDPLWRMPLVEEYRPALDSPVADLANVARGTRTRPGSIDAALFLREFTDGCPWAHLDIAGAARSAAEDGEISKGGTGYGTRLLLQWLAPAV